MTTKILQPNEFVVINEITYFRLQDGAIAVEIPNNVTIRTSEEDVVELITLYYNLKETSFWKTKNKIYALATVSCINVPEDVNFANCYYSSNYPEGMYVKYISNGRCGIIYVSETEVSYVISHEKGYKEICFANGFFYADFEEDNENYDLIDEAGNLLGSYTLKQIEFEDKILTYNKNKIFIDNTEFEISEGILSVEVVNSGKITFFKIINKNGIYYYTTEFKYLFGPIQDEQINKINSNSSFIYEFEDKKIIKIFYIESVKDTYRCISLSDKRGIKCIDRRFEVDRQEFTCYFFEISGTIYMLEDSKFTLLIKEQSDSYKYFIRELQNRKDQVSIAIYKNDIPIFIVYYNISQKQICDKIKIEETKNLVFTCICKTSNGEYIVLSEGSEKGIVYLRQKAQNCYDIWLDRQNYLFEIDDENIMIF